MSSRRYLGLVLLLVVGVGGCAEPSADNSAGAPPSVASSVAASPSAAGSPSAAPAPAQSLATGSITITGDVKDGVESGCLLLVAADKTYLLIGGDRAGLTELRSGMHVTLVGVPQPGMMSTCQQGTPFQVQSIQR